MYIAAKPNKARNPEDKEEMNQKYQPGDQVIPHVTTRERTAEERRAEEEDRRLVDEVREMSLREAEGGVPSVPPRRRRGSRVAEERISSRRARDDGRARRGTNQLGLLNDGHRRRRSESQQRQVGHQSSLRSLISSADLSERDIEREIEEFARQIQEEGLLDGLDLDNIDLTRDDELSRRITEAYRRRQRGRATAQPTRRDSPTTRNEANASTRNGDSRLDPRPRPLEIHSPSRSREGSSSRPATGSSSTEERDRRPPRSLEVRDPQIRPRRRTASDSRAATLPVVPTELPVRPAARSQTDLTLPNERTASSTLRPNTSGVRSSSVPSAPAELPASNATTGSSFASRLGRPSTTPNDPPRAAPDQPRASTDRSRASTDRPRASSASRPNRAAELSIVHSAATTPAATSPVPSGHRRTMSQLYPEPSITCMRCNKTHIEYEIHYNCGICAGGHWSMCSDCYRSGKGCQYWFGFGHGGWNKWRRRRQQRGDDSMAPPHILTPSRYQPPPSTPGGADGRKTLTMDDPQLRLESGTFCAKCQVWANDCYWRCDICNDGEWGYCNNCVNQGRSCTHPLLPLSHEIPQPHSPLPGRPTAARIVTESQARSISPFKPLSFATTCDICRTTITPSDIRYHCYSCTSSLVENAAPGDYDICSPCYADLVNSGRVSAENGHSGWRRCLKGHRMVVIGFAPGEVGHWRFIERDLVGGRKLRVEPVADDSQPDTPSQKWSWKQEDQKLERLVTQEVSAAAPNSDDSATYTTLFPPDGGVGLRVSAKWAWFPREEADDELLFPRGAEIREVEDVNGDWYFGVYMGAKGLFPSGYGRVEGDAS
ncbi:RING finger domain-containing protein [Beauveria bassiana ARSEF 2860]|uniref:RING finger domain-containing protein n=1 Tax=Beauveria bassiana (strain ARSEF 2860) TaxID=655819 RepID=J5K820_BEAB2|nr:RING finger domain-containing protein [Beauveria bassiana ARSEF 2860]EJP70241.1 RING finger domain-containing protein [Beauveria bassiana ARSEF 2860]